MRKNFFIKYLPTQEQFRQNKYLQHLDNFFHDPNLWHLNRHSVSGAVAVGLFVCYIPVPLQMIQAALLAIFFRVNLPISVSLVFITNPFTIPPMFYVAYRVGVLAMGLHPEPFSFQFSLDWLFLELGALWRPFLLGCMIMATLLSLSGFFISRIVWRMHLIQRIKERKLLRYGNKSAD